MFTSQPVSSKSFSSSVRCTLPSSIQWIFKPRLYCPFKCAASGSFPSAPHGLLMLPWINVQPWPPCRSHEGQGCVWSEVITYLIGLMGNVMHSPSNYWAKCQYLWKPAASVINHLSPALQDWIILSLSGCFLSAALSLSCCTWTPLMKRTCCRGPPLSSGGTASSRCPVWKSPLSRSLRWARRSPTCPGVC